VRKGDRYRTIHNYSELPGVLADMGFM